MDANQTQGSHPAQADACPGTTSQTTAVASDSAKPTMTEQIEILLNEVRYAERLCLRTARLYRRAQTFGVFVTILSGSAAVAVLAQGANTALALASVITLGIFGAAMLAIRPAEKAVINETDAKRYTQLRTAALSMDETTLREALAKAREIDAPEVETLRDVAFNDVVTEVGRHDLAVPLSAHQRLLAVLA